VYAGVDIYYHRCSGDNCSSDEEFEEWFRKAKFNQIRTSSYFDISDYENPIHYFLDDMYFMLNPSRTLIYDTFVKRNEINLSNTLFGTFYDKYCKELLYCSQKQFLHRRS